MFKCMGMVPIAMAGVVNMLILNGSKITVSVCKDRPEISMNKQDKAFVKEY